VTPDELVAFLEGIRAKAATAAPDAAMAMGRRYQDHLQNVTLVRYAHAPGTWTPSPPGQPPALMTGTLRRSITCTQGAGGGMYGSSVVAPHTIYARIQEDGGHIYARRRKYMRYTVDGQVHFAKHVYLPPRPYMSPAARECIADGSLSEAAGQSFMATVFG
jgi:hypothetical protein